MSREELFNKISQGILNEINADETSILSARGSRNFPSGVISLYFLA